MNKPTLAIVAAEFNQPLIEAMIAAARDELATLGGVLSHEIRVPGCYEAPLVVARLIERPQIDAVVILGYIERGETLHGEVMGHAVHGALLSLSLAARKPIGIGIVGPGATAAQAETRKVDYARAAVRAVFRSLAALDAAASG